jgi:phosphoenolpyruvate carboxykinase (ATP)
MKIAYTRAMVRAAIEGRLADVPMTRDPVFGFEVPRGVPDVPSEALRPRETWNNPAAYDAQARRLAAMFIQNFQQFVGSVSADVAAAGPTV